MEIWSAELLPHQNESQAFYYLWLITEYVAQYNAYAASASISGAGASLSIASNRISPFSSRLNNRDARNGETCNFDRLVKGPPPLYFYPYLNIVRSESFYVWHKMAWTGQMRLRLEKKSSHRRLEGHWMTGCQQIHEIHMRAEGRKTFFSFQTDSAVNIFVINSFGLLRMWPFRFGVVADVDNDAIGARPIFSL